MGSTPDAVVIGSGPNGLAAAIELQRSGYQTLVLEAMDEPGGGTRSRELTLPGFLHDECSAVHTTGILSPFFRQLPLAEHGLEWLQLDASVAHPLDDEPAVLLYRSLERTCAELDDTDRAAWRRLVGSFLRHPHDLLADILGPLRFPKRPLQMARFGLLGLPPASFVLSRLLHGPRARALFAGCAGHSVLPLTHWTTAALGLVFSVCAHVEAWPVARGGSQAIARALAAYLGSLGGVIETGTRVDSVAPVGPVGSVGSVGSLDAPLLRGARVVLFDVSPKEFLRIARDHVPAGYARRLERYRYGPGTFKLDWALDGPIPWRDSRVADATTVHVGGTWQEIASSEASAFRGQHADHPYLILCQQSHADPSRAPEGRHTGYAYCHVPHGSDVDMTERIEAQIERFAPGFRDRILARHATSPLDWEALNPNYVGGAITGGSADLTQLFTRPVARLNPYTTPNPRLFLCSAATPPGGGVHGMCGYWAARAAIGRIERRGARAARRRSAGGPNQ